MWFFMRPILLLSTKMAIRRYFSHDLTVHAVEAGGAPDLSLKVDNITKYNRVMQASLSTGEETNCIRKTSFLSTTKVTHQS